MVRIFVSLLKAVPAEVDARWKLYNLSSLGVNWEICVAGQHHDLGLVRLGLHNKHVWCGLRDRIILFISSPFATQAVTCWLREVLATELTRKLPSQKKYLFLCSISVAFALLEKEMAKMLFPSSGITPFSN